MEFKKKVSQITAYVNRNISKDILDSLKEVGVIDLHLAAARSQVIEERKGIFFLLPGRDLVDDPLDIISFLVAQEAEDSVLSLIIDKGQLNLPGRGSAYSEEITLGMAHELCQENKPDPFTTEKIPLHKLTGICCIVQRGQGDIVARLALDTGVCVPSLHFGVGTGVRDKMGLLRITIPAEKEIINIATSPFDAEVIMEMMIEVGKLEQPGKGFIYLYPLKQGIINMKVTRGEHRHAASIEQIVAAIDHIRGGAEWRRRTGSGEKTGKKNRDYLIDLVDLTLLCDGGTGTDLVGVAMSAGAPGATIARLKHVRPTDSPLSVLSHAREACSMIVSNNQVESILNALDEAGAFTDSCHGQVQLRRVPKAFTYLGK
ncbi:MAG: hypothetical protein ABII26_08315 [Pseudomonadota bacterium]